MNLPRFLLQCMVGRGSAGWQSCQRECQTKYESSQISIAVVGRGSAGWQSCQRECQTKYESSQISIAVVGRGSAGWQSCQRECQTKYEILLVSLSSYLAMKNLVQHLQSLTLTSSYAAKRTEKVGFILSIYAMTPCSRVRRSFRFEAKRCEKGSEKIFASKRNKGLVSLVSLRSETAIFACETKWT